MQPLRPTGAPKHDPRRTRSRGAWFVPVLCALALTGCKALEGVDHPFQAEPRPAPIAEIATSPTVMVAPVAGPPPEVGRVMAELVADSLRQRDVIAVTRNPPSGSLLLSGRSELLPQGKDHALLRVAWSLTQADGLTAGTFQSEETVPVIPGEDPYQRLAASTMVPFANRVAFKVADQVQTLPKQTQTASLTAPPGAASAAPPTAEAREPSPTPSESGSAASAPASSESEPTAPASTAATSTAAASVAPTSSPLQKVPPAEAEAGSAPASPPQPAPTEAQTSSEPKADTADDAHTAPSSAGAALAGAVASGAAASAASTPPPPAAPAPIALAAGQPSAPEPSSPAVTPSAPPTPAPVPPASIPVAASTASIAPPSATAQTASGAMSILVAPVQGAPGDGNQMLTDAIKRMLQRHGVAVTDYSTPGTLVLHGRVTVTPAQTDLDDVQLEWTVYDASGRFFGTVTQRNRLTREQVEGHWAETAMLAASGAANGIRSLIVQAQAAGAAQASSR